jgi:uncharacterized membrane protein
LRKNLVICFILISLLDLGLRLGSVTFDSLYLDESYQTLFDATGEPVPQFMELAGEPYLFKFADKPRSTGEVLHNLRSVDALGPPLYFVALNKWMSVFGTSDLSVRGFSALLSFASLVALFLLSAWLFGPAVAIYACLIQAVSPFELMYGQEARMYCLEILLCTVSSLSLMALLFKRPVRGRLAVLIGTYSISTWAILNTHYTAVFLVLFQGLFGVTFSLKHKDFRQFALLSAAWLLTLVMWIPWFDLFRQASAVRNDTGSFYVARKPTWYWPFWGLFLRIPINWVCFMCGNRVTAFAIPVYATAVAFLAAGAKESFHLLQGKQGEEHIKARVIFLLGWALFPAIALWFMDVIESRKVIEMARYLIFTAPAIFLVCGLGLARLSEDRKLVAALVSIHVLFALVNITNYHIIHQRRPWREMAAKVEEVVKPEDVLMVSHYFNIVCLDRYLSRPVRQVGLSPQLGAERINAKIEGISPKLNQFWLLTAEDGENIRDIMPQTFAVVQKIDLPHELHLRLYRRR